MKVDKRRPGDCDPTLMNARRKEKKALIARHKKPEKISEWLHLAEDIKKEYESNKHWRSKNDYARAKGYPPYKFLEWRKESEVFADALEYITYICASRRDEYMDSRDKLYLQYLKQLPQYDFEYADYEKSMKANKCDCGPTKLCVHREIDSACDTE